ncbi:Cytochrome P450 [Apodemus speciosus]|uniref:Cytochrome P450 n=1 Tax=Apodemus speciosus TaxID=105296 RepID=A0ABQ0EXK2_APOSI
MSLWTPTFLFQSITANIICSIVFGERFDYTDRQFSCLLELFYQILSLVGSFSSQDVWLLLSWRFSLKPTDEISKTCRKSSAAIGHHVSSTGHPGPQRRQQTSLMPTFWHGEEKVQKEIDQVIGRHTVATDS